MTSSRAGLRVAVVHGDLRAGGGAESYAVAVVATLDALGHDVTIYDFGRYLARLEAAGKLGAAAARVLNGLGRLETLTYAIVLRWFARHADDYDAVVFTYAECGDVPVPHARILHAPSMFSVNEDDLLVLGVDVGNRIGLELRRLYVRMCRRVGRSPSEVGAQCRLTIVNSEWTRGRVVDRVPPGHDVVLLYPPVRRSDRDSGPRDPNLVIMVGRLVPSKRHHQAVDVVGRAAELTGRPLRLVVAGRGTGRYVDELVDRSQGHRGFEVLRDLPDRELDDLLAAATFGIHMYESEHFGIAVAEMIEAGCLPLVVDGGGVTELVTDARCRFATLDEAAQRLAALATMPETQRVGIVEVLRRGDALTASLDFDHQARHLLESLLETVTTTSDDAQNS